MSRYFVQQCVYTKLTNDFRSVLEGTIKGLRVSTYELDTKT